MFAKLPTPLGPGATPDEPVLKSRTWDLCAQLRPKLESLKHMHVLEHVWVEITRRRRAGS
eukprot:10300578-Alexandrium_andersonii.AAC.1